MSDDTPTGLPALYAALAAAQGAFAPIAKNRSVNIRMKEGGSYAFRYADLEAVLAATRPALAANGLALFQTIVVDEGGNRSWLITTLSHSGGGELVSRLPLPDLSRMDDPKRFGAALTYLRRYQITALLCVAADDDLDEDGEDSASTDAKSIDNWRTQAPPPPPPRERADVDPQSPATITDGQVAWLKKKAEAVDGSAAILAECGITEISKTIDTPTFEKVKARLLRG